MKYLNVFVICVGLAIAGPIDNPRRDASANKIESICKERELDCDFSKGVCEEEGKVDEELLTCLNVVFKGCNADSECGDGYTCLPRPILMIGAGSWCQPKKEEKLQAEQKVTTDTQENTLTADVKKICENRGLPTTPTDVDRTSACDLWKTVCEEEGKGDEELLTCLKVIGEDCNADSECGDGYICLPRPITMIGAGSSCEVKREKKP